MIKFAKELGLNTTGAKFEIHDRISYFLGTGKKLYQTDSKTNSNFNWKAEKLIDSTIITDNYKNNQNSRKYFESKISGFNFNIDFMNYMKNNVGKTLFDAVEFYKTLVESRKKGIKQKIPEHNQYNRYMVEFLRHNPNKGLKECLICWQKKINLPIKNSKGRGFVYHQSDLKFLDKK